MASLWGTQSHSRLLRTNLGGQTCMESDNSSCQCPVTWGRWIWGEVVQPLSPLPGVLSLQVVHRTTFPLSPQGTISRDVTLLAMVASFLECSYQFTHLPTVGMKSQCLALHPCGGQLPFGFFQPAGYALGRPCGFTRLAPSLMGLSFSRHIYGLFVCLLLFSACPSLLPFSH